MTLVRDRFSWDSPEDAPETIFEGYHDPANRWNGFATPAFEKAEADRIVAWQQANPNPDNETIAYDVERDAYVVTNPSYPEDGPEYVEGFDVATYTTKDAPDGTKRLYAIGSWSWTWMEVEAEPARSRRDLAENGPDLAGRLMTTTSDETPAAIREALLAVEQIEDLLFGVYHNPAMPESVASIQNPSVRTVMGYLADARRELRRAALPVVHYARTAYTVQCGARSSSLSELTTTMVRAEVTCSACVLELQG